MEVFINSINAISPQQTFSEEKLLQNIIEYKGVRQLKYIEPDYSEFISPMSSRRMSRIIKFSVCSALKCLRDGGIENPDAIITGTSLGCIEDTAKFLGSIYENEEILINPTPFIQSTHNTVSAAIALSLRCNSYNNTYAHRGLAFEQALIDAIMFLNENPCKNVLTGAFEESTSDSFSIKDRLGFWKKESINNLSLLNSETKGTISGEGLAFFVLSDQKMKGSIAKLHSVNTFFNPINSMEVESKIVNFINETVGDVANIDLLIAGMNGDLFSDVIYYGLRDSLLKNVPFTFFKHLSGEYDTCSSFAFYLGSAILREQHVPDILRLDDKPINGIRNILIYNHLRNINHSLIMLSSC
jgi:3-oxoacyl-[acyl-carrier-protein] synthase II